MSGGSHDYVCFRIEEYLCDRTHDKELDDMMRDIAELAHDLEWMDSGDISPESYWKTVSKFKKKWFKGNREERLKKYVDASILDLKEQLYRMVACENE